MAAKPHHTIYDSRWAGKTAHTLSRQLVGPLATFLPRQTAQPPNRPIAHAPWHPADLWPKAGILKALRGGNLAKSLGLPASISRPICMQAHGARERKTYNPTVL